MGRAIRALVVLAVLVGGVALAWLLLRGDPQLEQAHETCEEEHSMLYISLIDDGESIEVDGLGSGAGDRDVDPEEFAGLACLFSELDVSSALVSEIDSTTAMMGRQSSTENDFRFTWSYHPESGVSMTIREQ